MATEISKVVCMPSTPETNFGGMQINPEADREFVNTKPSPPSRLD